MKLNLKRKVLGLVFLAATLPVLVMLSLTTQFERSVASTAEQELDIIASQSVVQTAKDIYALCDTSNQLIRRKASDDLSLARKMLQEAGGLTIASETVEWEAINQRTAEVTPVRLPKLLVGGQWFGRHAKFESEMPIVDELKSTLGIWCSILQRVDGTGDLVRVVTSVETTDGRRALGTFIPAVDADGKRNPLVQATDQGQPFYGMTSVAGRLGIIACEPIRDRQGKVIGVLGVMERPETLDTLRKSIMATQVGKTGYVCVLGGKGDLRGRYIISQAGKRDGENIWETRDAGGRPFIQEQIGRAVRQPAGEPTLERYQWQNPGEAAPRTKIASLVYFAPWDWAINVGTYQDDFYATKARINTSIRDLLLKLLVVGGVLLAGALALGVWLTGKATRPLGVTIDVANQIAAGDLSRARAQLKTASELVPRRRLMGVIDNTDETSQLLDAFGGMTGSLDSLIGQVQRSGIQVTTSATEISASARQLEAAVAEQAASTREVTATSKEISKTADDLVRLIGDVGDQLSNTAGLAESGRTDLGKMESAMRQLMKATGSITTKLATINERANRISSVVTTINKVSDQTNLLSLNAAIEAEKAGEYGKGFAVVAREISRLADQTAAATQDIEYVVREMQSSVAAGVMEMDKFAEQVRKGVGEVAGIGDELTKIIDQVRNLGPEFETVQQCMQVQSQGAVQISEAMTQLSQAVDQTRESLHEFKQATGQLNDAVHGLQGEVTRFKISA